MRRVALLLCAVLACAAAAPALRPPADARMPPDLALRDESGRATSVDAVLGGLPAVLVIADYTCVTLCGTVLGLAAATLPQTGLVAGRDYRLLAIGLDPKDGPAEAAAMRRRYFDDTDPGIRFLVADRPGRLTKAFGYEVAYDADADRYDHPLALLVLRPDGRLAAVLPALGTDPAALRAALRGAVPSQGPITLICRGIGLTAPGGTAVKLAAMGGIGTSLLVFGCAVVAVRRRARSA